MQKNTGLEEGLLRIFGTLGKFALLLGKALVIGFAKVDWNDWINCALLVVGFTLSCLLSAGNLIVIFDDSLANIWAIYLIMLALSFIVVGFPEILRLRKYQRDLDEVGLKSAKGLAPKVVKVRPCNEWKNELLIVAKGIGLDKFELKRSDLAASFKEIVEGITVSSNREFVVITLSKKSLPPRVLFTDLIELVTEPYHLLIGESMKGVIQDSIRTAPHYLISGSTGGGKSIFFANCLLSLAKSSLRQKGRAAIQFYLLDLKRGVEVKSFESWPNVRIAKDENQSLQVLKALKEEMDARYQFLESEGKGDKLIEPHRDKRDILILAIDEASVIFGKSKNKLKSKIIDECRDTFDELCKLARASAIHIIVATQKPIKESLDSRSIENLNGRVAFKMSSQAGSMLALGNAMAKKLPNIKGRRIWAGGNQFLEVQAPFLSEEEIKEECICLAEEFKRKEKGNYQEMLILEKEEEGQGKEFGSKMVKEKKGEEK